MLAMQLQIGLRDAVRVGHVVVDGRSSPSVRAGAVFLRPTDRGVDRHIATWMPCGIIPLPCSARVPTSHGMPLQRHRSTGTP